MKHAARVRFIFASLALLLCTTLHAQTPEYLGCFKDQGNPQGTSGRDLSGFMSSAPNMTGAQCVAACQSRGFAYAGTQYGSYCFCGNEYGKSGPAANCNVPCAGNARELCGGAWANSVYRAPTTLVTQNPTRQLVRPPKYFQPAPVVAPAGKMCVGLPRPYGHLPAPASRNFFRILQDGTVVGVIRSPLAAVTDRVWNPGQVLRVRFMGGSTALRARVRAFADEWRPHANVDFTYVADNATADIRIAFVEGDGSWSYIGRDATLIDANASTMNFGWFKDDTDDIEVRRTTVHEFGHALGMIHEHQSPVADIPWDVPKVYAWYSKNMQWDKAKVDANVLTKSDAATTNYSAYDPTSIMQYPVPASLTTNGMEIGMNTQLSSMDKAAVREWYPFPVMATGTLRTGDDCDAIDFKVTRGVVPQGQFLVRLGTGGPVNWWKSIKIPFTGGGLHEIETGGIGGESRWTFWHSVLDDSRPIYFSKAKFLGAHTQLPYAWNVIRALPDGGELSLVWVKDSCRQ